MVRKDRAKEKDQEVRIVALKYRHEEVVAADRVLSLANPA